MGHPDNKTSQPAIDPYSDQSYNYTLSLSLYSGIIEERVFHTSGIKKILKKEAENFLAPISSFQTQHKRTGFRSDFFNLTTLIETDFKCKQSAISNTIRNLFALRLSIIQNF